MSGYRTWREALDDVIVPDDWLNDLEHWPEWSWPHLTDAMVNREASLPFRIVYGVLVDRSGLPMPTRAVLHFLARRCGGSGPARRCWPPLDTIADRVGASRRTVQRAIDNAEAEGWVRVVRHTRAPSDYVLDVPDLASCPCRDCREPGASEVRDEQHDEPSEGVSQTVDTPGDGVVRQGVTESPQGVTESPHTGQRVTPGCQSDTPRVSESHTHLVQALGSEALGSSLDSEHLRRPSGEGTTTGVPPSEKRTDRADQGRTFAAYVASGTMTLEDVLLLAEGIPGIEERQQFAAAFKSAMKEAA